MPLGLLWSPTILYKTGSWDRRTDWDIEGAWDNVTGSHQGRCTIVYFTNWDRYRKVQNQPELMGICDTKAYFKFSPYSLIVSVTLVNSDQETVVMSPSLIFVMSPSLIFPLVEVGQFWHHQVVQVVALG